MNEAKLKSKHFSLFVSALVVGVALVIGTGCISKPPRPVQETKRSEFGTVGVIPAHFVPASNFDTFAKDRLSGTQKGAISGATIGAVQGAATGAASGPFAVFLIPLLTGVGATVGGTVGGIYGWTSSVPESTAIEIDKAISTALIKINTQVSLAENVSDYGRRIAFLEMEIIPNLGPGALEERPVYKSLPTKIGTILEISVQELGFQSEGYGGNDPSLQFFMTARARCLRINEGAEIYSRDFIYLSGTYNLSEWAENNAKRLQREFDRSYDRLAERIIEEIFLLVGDSRGGYGGCGLSPQYPKPEYGFFKKCQEFVEIDSVQPVFKWEALSELEDNSLGFISRVVYDLKIWKADKGYLGDLVYGRNGLESSQHKIENPLEFSTSYFWTVRARFELNGRHRANDWAFASTPGYHASAIGKIKGIAGSMDGIFGMRLPCTLDFIPECNYYRFTTPSK